MHLSDYFLFHNRVGPFLTRTSFLPLHSFLMPRMLREICHLCGQNPLPTSEIRSLLSRATIDDVGLLKVGGKAFRLEQNLSRFRHIATITLFESPAATVTIFVLPPQTVLPLHDHPRMHVLCKVLAGSISTVGFDWANAVEPGGSGEAILVKRELSTVDAPLAEIGPSTGGIVHEIRNPAEDGGDCAVFCDVITPPYSPIGESSCTYYQAHKALAAMQLGERCVLSPLSTPPVIRMDAIAPYHAATL